MISQQVDRLVQAYPSQFNADTAAKAVARAYGYHKLDLSTGELSEPVPGLQLVRPYGEFLHKDPTHQAIDLMRMALNLGLPDKVDFRNGIAEQQIVSTMIGFSNFSSIISYAKSDMIDPNTTDKNDLERFSDRYGHLAPIQYLLGLYTVEPTLVIQPDSHLAQRFVDQEISLNPLNSLRVVLVRDEPKGDSWLQVTLPRSVASYRGSIDNAYPEAVADALGTKPVMVSMIEPVEYSLSQLVQAHLSALNDTAFDGRTLIIDRLSLTSDTKDFDNAYKLAADNNIHLVVIVNEPDAELWSRSAIKLIFGFTDWETETHLDMDTHLGFAAPYVRFNNGKMQYLYVSEPSGARYGAIDYIPDDPKTKSLVKRLEEAISG